MKSYFYRRWILLFSHSGSEASALVTGMHYNIGQDISIYTNQTELSKWQDNFKDVLYDRDGEEIPMYNPVVAKSSIIYEQLKAIDEPTLVTCHGWNRIIPAEVINNPHLTIFNLHPGDILNYPTLKGKDPQEKAIDMGLLSTGNVLHKVTPEVDGGPIYGFNRVDIKSYMTLKDLVAELKEAALDLWFPFLIRELNKDE